MHWRRKWQPTPVFLPGESQGQRSLVGCCPWGRTESYMTEVTQQQQQLEEDIAESWVVCEACGSWGKLAFQRTQDFHSEGHHCSTWWSPFSLLLLKLIKGWITGSYPSYHSEGKGERPLPMLHKKSDSLPAGLLLTTGAEKWHCPECQDWYTVKHLQLMEFQPAIPINI